jgi:RNA polymerase sigma-70 factor (ECF subfamily)
MASGVERRGTSRIFFGAQQLRRFLEKSVNPIDSDRFLQLFAQHQRSVHAYIHSLVPSRVDADDVMQETCLVLWRKWGEFDPNRDFIRWACGIAFHEVLKLRRRAATSRCYFNEELLEQLSVEAIPKSDELESRQVALFRCLSKLGASDRELIERRYRAKTTARQVANDLDRPASTIYKSLARIRNALFDCVERTLAQEAHP